MDRNNRIKLLLPVIGCCALLMLSQIAADMIFTIFIVAGMNIDGMTSAEADALLYEHLSAYNNEIMILSYVFTLIGLVVWARLAFLSVFIGQGKNFVANILFGCHSLGSSVVC